MHNIAPRALLEFLERRSLKINELSCLGLSEELLNHLCRENVVHLDHEALQVVDPIRLAFEAIKLGADVEAVSELLSWKDFENLCVEALRIHGYVVRAPLRFKVEGKRYEVDIVAHRKGFLLCVDCKHWKMKRGQKSKVKDATTNHLDKCAKLALSADILRSAGLEVRTGSHVVPVIVTLMDLDLKSPLNGVCVVPIFKFNNFLLELEAHVDELSCMTTC
jgi:Holliday junction resolvase-like predicted endonuclease